MVLHVQTWTPAGSCDQPCSTGLHPTVGTLLALWGHHRPCNLARGLSPTLSPGTLCCLPLGSPDCALFGWRSAHGRTDLGCTGHLPPDVSARPVLPRGLWTRSSLCLECSGPGALNSCFLLLISTELQHRPLLDPRPWSLLAPPMCRPILVFCPHPNPVCLI